MIIAALFLAREDRNMSRLKRLADPRGDRLIQLVNAVRRSRLLAEVEEDSVFVVRRGRKIPLQSRQQPPLDERMERGEQREQQQQRDQIASPPEPINKGRATAGQRHQ